MTATRVDATTTAEEASRVIDRAATLVLNPAPIGRSENDRYDLYPERSCFIFPTELHITVPALHVECTCTEMVTERPDTAAGRCALLDFARVHAETCGFPTDEVKARLP